MRISTDERAVIVDEVTKRDQAAIVYLFGSRADDAAKGGDIDLLVESATITFADKLGILSDIKARIGDQKIDLVLTKDRLGDLDPFIVAVSEGAVRL
jgi:predicted nucleotidyltransferase